MRRLFALAAAAALLAAGPALAQEYRFSANVARGYRPAILSAIAQDALTTARAFGDDYRVEVTGLSRQVTWRRAGPLDLMLYIPYQLGVTPGG